MQNFLEGATILHPDIFGKNTVLTSFDESDKATYDLFACFAAAIFAEDYSRSALMHIDPSILMHKSVKERLELIEQFHTTFDINTPLLLIMDGGRIVEDPSDISPRDVPPHYISSSIVRLLGEAGLSATLIGETPKVRVSHSYMSRYAVLNHSKRSLTTYLQDEID